MLPLCVADLCCCCFVLLFCAVAVDAVAIVAVNYLLICAAVAVRRMSYVCICGYILRKKKRSAVFVFCVQFKGASMYYFH